MTVSFRARLQQRQRRLVCVLAVVVALSTPGAALAQEAQAASAPATLPQRQANFAWDKSLLRASFSFRDLFSDAALRAKLGNGPSMVIALRAYVWEKDATSPLALAVRTCKVNFDLWDEVYRIRMQGPEGERDLAVLNVEGVLRQCAEARDLIIADRSVLKPGKPHFLAAIVEVNPVSEDMLREMRRWVQRPLGSTGIRPGDALFGSFVGLFLGNIGKSDKTLQFRTQMVSVGR